MICPKHNVQMKKGKVTHYCPECVSRTSGIGDNAETDKAMKTSRNKWGYSGKNKWTKEGQFAGKVNPGKRKRGRM